MAKEDNRLVGAETAEFIIYTIPPTKISVGRDETITKKRGPMEVTVSLDKDGASAEVRIPDTGSDFSRSFIRCVDLKKPKIEDEVQMRSSAVPEQGRGLRAEGYHYCVLYLANKDKEPLKSLENTSS
jgi:hypothetical protein